MKELKRNKQVKKKPGEFKKAQKKHQNIQHNRDQIKLLREGKIDSAELFILDPDAFKRVTIVLSDRSNKNYDYSELCKYGEKVVFLFNRGKKSKLRTGLLSEKDGFKVEGEPGGHINPDDIFGIIVKEEILKDKDIIGKQLSKQFYSDLVYNYLFK